MLVYRHLRFHRTNGLLGFFYVSFLIVFLDISDIRDDVICYELKGDIVIRRNDLTCLQLVPSINDKILASLKRNLRLSFEFYRQIKIKDAF